MKGWLIFGAWRKPCRSEVRGVEPDMMLLKERDSVAPFTFSDARVVPSLQRKRPTNLTSGIRGAIGTRPSGRKTEDFEYMVRGMLPLIRLRLQTSRAGEIAGVSNLGLRVASEGSESEGDTTLILTERGDSDGEWL